MLDGWSGDCNHQYYDPEHGARVVLYMCCAHLSVRQSYVVAGGSLWTWLARREVSSRSCYEEVSERWIVKMHGQKTQYYRRGVGCADYHGANEYRANRP
jgi:hypothetical protein